MELIYTTRRSGFEPGKHYRNPRYFVAPEHGATLVIIEGDYPAIASAYEAAGVIVSKPAQAPQAETTPKAQSVTEAPAEGGSRQKRGRPRKAQE